MKRFLLAAVAALCFASAAEAAGLPANTLQSSVASVTAQSSTAGVMAGLAAAAPQFTPHYDGVALITVSGTAVFGTTGAVGVLQLRYGTGAGPANNATATGIACGPTLAPTALTGVLTQMFSMQCIATGMTLNVPYWVDMVMGASTGNVQLTNVSVSAAEM